MKGDYTHMVQTVLERAIAQFYYEKLSYPEGRKFLKEQLKEKSAEIIREVNKLKL